MVASEEIQEAGFQELRAQTDVQFVSRVAGTPYTDSGRSEKFSHGQISSTLPLYFKSPQSFGYLPRLVHPPPDGYYYRDFHRLNVVCDLMSYCDLLTHIA
ncbi:hypothetical protein TNCV_3272891 [Trichonephila clavipes]|nr:hypothetical protein TNCV_3272891 [Trichonephila clavipes]